MRLGPSLSPHSKNLDLHFNVEALADPPGARVGSSGVLGRAGLDGLFGGPNGSLFLLWAFLNWGWFPGKPKGNHLRGSPIGSKLERLLSSGP